MISKLFISIFVIVLCNGVFFVEVNSNKLVMNLKLEDQTKPLILKIQMNFDDSPEKIADVEINKKFTEDSCLTPDKIMGKCMNIKQCRTLISLLKIRPQLPVIRKYLLESHCGFEHKDPKVCCPADVTNTMDLNLPSDTSENTMTFTSTTQQPVTIESRIPIHREPPIPISDHKNVTLTSATRQLVTIEYGIPFYSEPPPSISGHRNLYLLPDACGSVEEDKLVGGNKTGIYEFPWMALLFYNSSKGVHPQCGGTMINSRYILTAAHCLKNLGRFSLVGVRVGEHNLDTEEDCELIPGSECTHHQDLGIEEIVVHPGYSKHQNDIGLVRLNQDIDMNTDNVYPICLPTTKEQQELTTDGLNMIVTGWGVTEKGISSNELLKISIPIIDNLQCGNRLNNSIRDGIGFRQICAGGMMGSDSCHGDSGGPLQYVSPVKNVLRYVQHGIVSFGSKQCGTRGFPGVYTRVAHYMDWILDNLKP